MDLRAGGDGAGSLSSSSLSSKLSDSYSLGDSSALSLNDLGGCVLLSKQVGVTARHRHQKLMGTATWRYVVFFKECNVFRNSFLF